MKRRGARAGIATAIGSALVFLAGCFLSVDSSDLASGTPATNGNGGDASDAGQQNGNDATPSDGNVSSDTQNDGGGGGDGASDATTSTFIDSFDRADGVLGNGWTLKDALAFKIAGQKVVAGAEVSKGYVNVLAFRPDAEDALNVEIAADCTVPTFSGVYPQIHARVQRSTVNALDKLDSYVLFLNGESNLASIIRQHGGQGLPITATFALSPPLVVADRFRLTMKVSGTSPVLVDATVERLDPAGPVQLGKTTFTDTAADRIQTAGTVGFSADNMGGQTYDNFVRNTYSP